MARERCIICGNKADVFIKSHDQTKPTFHLSIHRARENLTSGYRPRRIQLETSPESFGEPGPAVFATRSFGIETGLRRVRAGTTTSGSTRATTWARMCT